MAEAAGDIATIWDCVRIAIGNKPLRNFIRIRQTITVAIRFAFVGHAVGLDIVAGSTGNIATVGN